jgi:hypothetical protein
MLVVVRTIPSQVRQGAGSRSEEAGQEGGFQGAGGRYQVAEHESHRLTESIVARQAAGGVANQCRPSKKGLDQNRYDVFRSKPSRHCAVIGPQGARFAPEVAVDRAGRELGGDERSMEPLPTQRIEEARSVAYEEPTVA